MSEQPGIQSLGCAYPGQYHIEQFERDLEEIVRADVERLYLPMTEEDLELRRPNLEAMAAMARDADLEAWFVPWGVGGVFGGPGGTQFVAHHLDARQADSAGESLPAACPNNPRFLHFMENWLHGAVEAGAQGVLFDQPAWARHAVLPQYRDMDVARLWTCWCESCQRRFRSLYRRETAPEEADDDVRDFRARSMAAFLRDVGESAQRRGLKVGLRLSPYGSTTTWETIAGQPWIAEISASAFWAMPGLGRPVAEDSRLSEFERLAEAVWGLLERLGALSPEARVFLWLRCFQIRQEDEPLIPKTVAHLLSLGVRDYAVWSFGGTASLGALACARPAESWRATLEALGA